MVNPENSHPHSGARENKEWFQFEARCVDLVNRSVNNKQYRVEAQRNVAGSRKSVDIHIAERRRGGKHFVFDCKHYPKSKITKADVDSTYAYKRDMRASLAFMLISSITFENDNFPRSAQQYAESLGVIVLDIAVSDSKWIRRRIEQFQFSKSIHGHFD